jgi:hypothetical protein
MSVLRWPFLNLDKLTVFSLWSFVVFMSLSRILLRCTLIYVMISFNTLIYLPSQLPDCLPTSLSIYVLTYLPTDIHTYVSTRLTTYVPMYLPACLLTYLPTYRPTYIPIYSPTYRSTCLLA